MNFNFAKKIQKQVDINIQKYKFLALLEKYDPKRNYVQSRADL